MEEATRKFAFDEPSLVCNAIVSGVAEQTGQEVTNLPVLYDTVDSDALVTLARDGCSCQVSFEYAGYEVTVSSTNRIVLHDSQSDAEAGQEGVSPTSPDGLDAED